MTKLADIGFTAEESAIMDAAFSVLGEKFANLLMDEAEKEGPCILCQNDDPGRCPFCPATPKKEVK